MSAPVYQSSLPQAAASYQSNAVQPMAQQSHMLEQSPNKDINTAALCHFGQETVNDIVYRTCDLFQTLKTLQLPNGVNCNMDVFQEKRNKLNATTEAIRGLFQKLHVCYNRVLLDMSTLEPNSNEDLIPYQGAVISDTGKSSDIYRYVNSERQDLINQIRVKNSHLKEVMDQLHTLMWEMNTMIMMRKS